MRMTRAFAALTTATAVLAVTACGSSTSASDDSSSEDALVIYSGRNEKLVGPLLADLEKAVGSKVEVRYGDSAEMSAQILEEGKGTKADLFLSQDAGALGALAKEGRLATLDQSVTDTVLPGYADDDGRWVATSARARVVVYNPKTAPEVAQMDEIDDVVDAKYSGRVGVAPTNASFQSFVTALRVVDGEDDAKEWLTELKDNKPTIYEKNGAILQGVEDGEVDLGLINHYYWYELVAEKGADKVTSKIRFLNSDDPGALINVAGVGVIEGTEQSEAATKAVEYLLSKEGQTYFADTTAEYPVVEGITSTKHDLPPLTELKGSKVDLNDLDSLPATLDLLSTVGLT